MSLRYPGGALTVFFGINQAPLTVTPTTEAGEGSLSGIYYKIHLPSSTDRDKTNDDTDRCEVDVNTEILYDQPDDHALISVLLTAGGNPHPVHVDLSLWGVGAAEDGRCGTEILFTLDRPR